MTFGKPITYNQDLIVLYGTEFVEKTRRTDDLYHDCWEWIGRLNSSGYGVLDNGFFAHRISFLIYNGDLPAGFEVDHLCRNRKCVNPNHLDGVPKKINQDRKFLMRNPDGS